jgi:hypothetical protein
MENYKKFKDISNYDYDIVVNIGIRCFGTIASSKCGIKQNTYTFDWIQSNPQIILDCIKNNFDKYNNFNHEQLSKIYGMNIRYPPLFNINFPKKFINEYGMCFTHFREYNYNIFLELCRRRSDRFMELLQSDKKILFIYVSDNNMEPLDLQEKQYTYLLELEKYLISNYSDLTFKILAIHNLEKNNTKCINNLLYNNVSIENFYFGTGLENILTNFFKFIFKNRKKYPQKKIFK